MTQENEKELKCRKEFEKWFCNGNPPDNIRSLSRYSDGYIDSNIHSAWKAWQAAWNFRTEPNTPLLVEVYNALFYARKELEKHATYLDERCDILEDGGKLAIKNDEWKTCEDIDAALTKLTKLIER